MAKFDATSRVAGRIVEWDDLKGYGFLKAGEARVFAHRGEFSNRRRQPKVGDAMVFTMGEDAQGRTCAKNVAYELPVRQGAAGGRARGGVTLGLVLWLAALLATPLFALHRRGVELLWSGAHVVVWSVFSYAVYAWDKRRAQSGQWRIPENWLHLSELAGGWPGALVAQQRLRHKCAKTSYRFVFWLIVIGYQFVAVDSLVNWKLSRTAWRYVQGVIGAEGR